MKKLILETVGYNYIETSFTEWLDVLGYSESARVNWPAHVREFLWWLEQHKIKNVMLITSKHLLDFMDYLRHRRKHRGHGGLSSQSIKNITVALNVFGQYLNKVKGTALEIQVSKIGQIDTTRHILTTREIKQLYESTYESTRENSQAMGQRDRAILAIFYGCGLRKNEGTWLNVDDINFRENTVHVRQGKGRKERLVPITGKHLDDLDTYINDGRYWFMEDHAIVNKKGVLKQDTDKDALFLGQGGKRIKSGFYSRLKLLKQRSGITKPLGLHTFRHSIATHLLIAGMDIEQIRDFLGHASLESTQIYTHIAHNLKPEDHEQF